MAYGSDNDRTEKRGSLEDSRDPVMVRAQLTMQPFDPAWAELGRSPARIMAVLECHSSDDSRTECVTNSQAARGLTDLLLPGKEAQGAGHV